MSDVSARTGNSPTGADPWLQMLDDLSNGTPKMGHDGIINDDEIDRLMGLSSASDRRSGKDSVRLPCGWCRKPLSMLYHVVCGNW